MSKRRNSKACINCERTDFIDAVDNFSRPYRGCKWCRVVSLDEIANRLRARVENPGRA